MSFSWWPLDGTIRDPGLSDADRPTLAARSSSARATRAGPTSRTRPTTRWCRGWVVGGWTSGEGGSIPVAHADAPPPAHPPRTGGTVPAPPRAHPLPASLCDAAPPPAGRAGQRVPVQRSIKQIETSRSLTDTERAKRWPGKTACPSLRVPRGGRRRFMQGTWRGSGGFSRATATASTTPACVGSGRGGAEGERG